MAIVRFEPWRGFEGMTRKMSRFANDFEKGFSFEMGGYNPRVDITEDAKNIFIHAEIPGMNKDNIKISVNDDRMLTLTGEKQRETKSEGKTFLRTERSFGSFSRSFVLPENANLDSISAKFENGLLEMQIAKKEPEKPKEYEISIN